MYNFARSSHNYARIIILIAVVFFSLPLARAQQRDTDGTTPLGLSPGAPAGSYALSEFENLNLFNGGLNFSLPLTRIGGRGGAGFPITMRIDHKWLVMKEPTDTQPPINYYYPMPGWWTDLGWAPIYSVGRVEGRQGGNRNYVIVSPCGYVHQTTLTRLTFIAPDGTEYELRDQLTNGQPAAASCSQFNRGTVFVTADGTAATFISDANILDYPFDNPGDLVPSGYMMLRDGTKFRIDGGKISWMRDRNGNKITFTYDLAQRPTVITDSLNRQVSFSYNTGPGTYDQISFKGFGGATRTIKVYFSYLSTVLRSDYTMLTLNQMFPELNGAGGSYDASVVSAIEFPNGQQYQFRYNSYGELARVVLPTGGAIEYDHAAGTTDSGTSGVLSGLAEKHVYRRLIERRVYPDGSSGSSYATRTTYSRPETTTTNAGYVTTDQYNSSGTLLTRIIHYFYGSARASFFKQPTDYPAWTDGKEYKTETFAPDGTTLLRRVETTFAQRAPVSWWTGSSATAPPNDVRVTDISTTLADTNQVSKQIFGYDDSVPFNNRNNVKEYDFGSGAPGALLRETRTTYLTSSTYTDTSVHVRSLPTQISIYDAGSLERGRTVFEYDNYVTDTNHAGLADRSSISGMDSAFTTGYTTRGNVTAITNYFLSAGSVTGSVASYSQYDIAGDIVKTIDTRGNATTLFYTDCFGAPNGEARTNTAPTELGGLSSYAFVTKATNALNQSSYFQFDFYLGRPVDSEDPNGIIASSSYSDSMDRPTQLRRAAGTALTNQTTYSYDDTNRIVTTTRDRDLDNDNLLVTKVVYDQMGRVSEKRQYEGGTNYIGMVTQYDVLGRPYRTSNPYRPSLGETAVWTTLAYDNLDRVISITTPDNAVMTSTYSGNTVTVSDPASKKRKTVIDGVNRVKQVYEDPDSLSYQTTYDYDVLDNLITITQGSQTRAFAYDSLKRLSSATNPESGTINYQYDNAGNLLVKTDARGVSAHFAYDALNRLTRRWYNGSSSTSSTTNNSPALPSGVGASDEANFYYDSQTLPTGAPSFTRGSSVGRQVAVTYGVGSSAGDYFGYDALGRATVKIQQTGGVNYQMNATYNLAGAMASAVYPSGHSATYAYDSAGRTTSVSGNLGDGTTRTYSNEIVYSPFGGMAKEKFGTTTPIYNKLFYNVRGQLSEIRESTSYTGPTDTTWNRGAIINSFSDQCTGICAGSSMTDNNGNLHKQDIWIPADDQISSYTLRSQQYDYDSLNRLNSAREVVSGTEQWKQQFTYDRWGNRTINTGVTYGAGINNKAFAVDTATNRLGVPSGQSGVMSYDLAGNLTNDTYTSAGTRTYDAENKITSAWGGANQAQLYSYDASGRRIKRTVDTIQTWQVYGFSGELLAEYASSGAASSPKKEYGYRNGQLLVSAVPSTGQRVNFALANGAYPYASASSSWNLSFTPNATNNGDRKGLHWGFGPLTGNGWQDATPNTYPDWLQIDFNQSRTIDEIDVFTIQDNWTDPVEPTESMTFTTQGITSFDVQYWNGTSWVTVPGGNITGNNKVWRKITFSPVTTSMIRVVVNAALNDYSRIVELEAWGTSGGGPMQLNYMVTDHLGTPRMILDQTGSLANVKRHDYLPFGEELFGGTNASPGAGGRKPSQGYGCEPGDSSCVADGVRQQFTAQERDLETGLDYFNARYYSPVQGRFTSPDSFGGRLMSPQSFNRYTYVLNNPLRLIDPSGYDEQDPKKDGTKRPEDEISEPPAIIDPADIVVINSKPANEQEQKQEDTSGLDEVNRRLMEFNRKLMHINMLVLRWQISPISTTIKGVFGEEGLREYHHTTMALLPLAFEAGIEMKAEEVTAAMEGEMEAIMELNAETIIVRGGEAALPPAGTVFSGAQGATLEEAAAAVPHGTIRESTVGAIESSGGTVIPKPELTRAGNLNPRHVNITEGKGPSTFSEPFKNPVPKKDRIQ